MTIAPDPTKIDLSLDLDLGRMRGMTAHGNAYFDVPFITHVKGNLYQGGCQDGLALPNFIENVISLYPWEKYIQHRQVKSTLEVWLQDSTREDMAQIDAIAIWALERAARGPTLIHCQAGLNRSSLVVARALILDGMTPPDAIALIRAQRSPACLCNPAFEKWLLSSNE
jgi:protein-tyrosine phosphatase